MIQQTKLLTLCAVVVGAFSWLGSSSEVLAATQTTGDIFGEVTDAATKKPVSDAIVVATSPSLQGEQTAISDERGRYRIDALPPGTYTIAVTAPSYKNFEQTEVTLYVSREVKVVCQLLPEVVTGEEIVVKRQITSVIDQGSATTGLTVGKDYMDKVAAAQGTNTFNAIVEATPGAHSDDYGTSFNGASSPENGIYIDGVNATNTATGATDPNVGIVPTQMPLEFIDQVEVKTGGYLPEYGNASGAVISVLSKIGGNEFHGSVFDYLVPVQASATPIGGAGSAIVVQKALVANEQVGFDLGGPIIKDYLWFNVGFAPQVVVHNSTRSFQEQNMVNGAPDLDKNGLPKTTPLNPRYDRVYREVEAVYLYTGKLTLNASENHRLTASISGNPATYSGLRTVTNPIGANGADSSIIQNLRNNNLNLALLYDGKILDKKILVHASAAYARADENVLPYPGNAPQVEWTHDYSISKFEPNITECAGAVFANGAPRCPSSGTIGGYTTGGTGFTERRVTERIVLNGNLTGLFNALGSHQLKVGGEYDLATYYHAQAYTGGDALQVITDPANPNGLVYADARRFGTLINQNLPPTGGLYAASNINYVPSVQNRVGYDYGSAYAQDQWNLFDLINLNGGARFDYQNMRGGSLNDVNAVGPSYFAISNFAPRLGAIYDFTRTGRSKLYGSWGRYFEMLPLDMMERNFPPSREAQVNVIRQFCNNPDPSTCPIVVDSVQNSATAQSGDAIYKNLLGPYTEQFQVGFEYQILSDLLAGINLLDSQLHQVIEDSILDESQSNHNYIIGNPSISQPQKTSVTLNEVTGTRFNMALPVPSRKYDGMTIYLQKALGHNFIGNVSYVLSYLRGNYAGLVNTVTGQLDPNIQEDFDLVSMQPNRYGPLSGNQTHQFKIDGTYIIQVSQRFSIVPNASMRIASGDPYSYLAPQFPYGANESYLLQRGAAGNTDAEFYVNLGLNMDYAMSKDTHFQFGIYGLNLFDNQYAKQVDQRFVQDDQFIKPIPGGDASDLTHLKTTSLQPAKLNANFGNAVRRYDPTQLRLMAKVTF